MRVTAFNVVLWFEGARLLAWATYLAWLCHAYEPSEWVGPESSLFAIIPSFWLGFPYAWIANLVAGNWNLLGVGSHLPLAIAFTHFGVWLIATAILLAAISRMRVKR